MLRQSLWRNENGKEGIRAGGGGHGCGSGDDGLGHSEPGDLLWPSYGETGGTAEEYRDGLGGPGALQDADMGRNCHFRGGLCAPPDGYRLFIYGFGMEPGTGELERQSLDSVFSDQRETE